MPTGFSSTILRFDTIDSTNLEAIRQARVGAPEGLCVIAREQSVGRGRLDRTWHSPKDAGLYFSIVLRPKLPMNLWPLLPLVSALAVSDALMKSCGLRADIKWPNDILANERKLCGILAETLETASGAAAIIGIGINLTKAAVPEALRSNATSLEEMMGHQIDGERILTELLETIAERYQVLQSEGGAEHTIREWCGNSSYAFDRVVRVSSDHDSFEGRTRGLQGDGALRVETGDGKLRVVRAGDVTAVRATTNSASSESNL
ncbi:MAG: biotin--[acetyl-CoA-carboxylase] ligase [Acidobacteria bacterium]|nr:MAG: biotin--[acetyl-CoA-carboxylase] ligase [Acidobacteriota bacterium]